MAMTGRRRVSEGFWGAEGPSYSQIPAAPTPLNARPKMRTFTSLQLPQMTEPTSKMVIAESRQYSAQGERGGQRRAREV
jgi:hypothetical protein